jgi:hypothetical protein
MLAFRDSSNWLMRNSVAVNHRAPRITRSTNSARSKHQFEGRSSLSFYSERFLVRSLRCAPRSSPTRWARRARSTELLAKTYDLTRRERRLLNATTLASTLCVLSQPLGLDSFDQADTLKEILMSITVCLGSS